MAKFIRFFLLAAGFVAVFSLSSSAQIGGDNTYEFLNLVNSARTASMGGNFLTIKDDDLTLALANPSLITPAMHNDIALSFVNYFAGINYGYAMYSRTFHTIGSFAATLQYIDYGKFTYADASGLKGGDFTAGEYALNIGWGRQLTPLFSIGSNLKAIYSSLESYHSFGLAVDVAGTYKSKNELFTSSLIMKNLGTQIVAYREGNAEKLPFEIQWGMSEKFRHLPFRFSLLLNHLEKWDLAYEQPADPYATKDPFSGEPKKKKGLEKIGDNFMRHVVIGGEANITKNFFIRAGYNYQRRQEMKVSSKMAMVGFSWGFGFRVKMFQLNYARSTYHLNGSPNYITLAMHLGQLLDKKGE